MFRKLLPLILVALVAAGYFGTSAGTVSSNALFNAAQRMKGAENASSRVILVTVDGPSLDASGAWPWNVAKIKELALGVASWGPRAIVLTPEILKISPDPYLWKELAARSSVVVMPLLAGNDSQCAGVAVKGESDGFAQASGGAIRGLCESRILWGVDSLWFDPSNTRVPLLFKGGAGEILPGMAVVAAQAGSMGDGRWWVDGQLRIAGTKQISADGSVLANLPMAGSVPHVSASDLLKGQVVGGQFKDKIVVIGVTAAGIEPVFDAPVTGAVSGNRMPQSEFLAAVIGGLLDGSHYRELENDWLVAMAFFILSLVPFFIPRLRQKLWLGLAGGLLLLGAGVGCFAFAFSVLHVWLNPIPLVLFPLVAMAGLALWPRPVAAIRETSRTHSIRMPRSPDSNPSSVVVTTVKEATEVLDVAKREEDRIVRNERGEYQQIGRFVQLTPLGQGGMCTVFQAYDPKMERHVAIKILRADKTHTNINEARFLREARVAGSLHHANINTLFEYGRAEDLWYLVLEFIEGQTLSQWIKENPGARPAAILPWVRQISSALDLAHKHQVIHRDVKPSNFMIQKDNGSIKLMDFGVANTPDVTLTQAGTTVGTPNYMSPEQLQGSRVGPASDQYSLGVVVYQMLTQRVPFHGDGLTALCNNILKGHSTHLYSLRPDLPRELCDVVHKAFAVKAEDRFDNCSSFSDSLIRAIEG